MIATVFHLIHTVLGPNLASWASQLHAFAIAMLALAWFTPLIVAMFRLVQKSEPEIDWIQLWCCPRCGTYNRRTFSTCTHCEYHIQVGGLARWIPLKLIAFATHSGKRILTLYRFVGWSLFYGLTAAFAWKLRLYTFHQNPLQEFLASITFCLFLWCVWMFYLALRPRFKSPFDALTDLIAGVVLLGLVALGFLLWTEARTPPNPVLAAVHTETGNVVAVGPPGRTVVRFIAPVSGKSLKFDVQYSVLLWPVAGVRHVILLRAGGMPLMSDAVLWIFDDLGSPLKTESYYRPQLLLFTQSFLSPPNASLALYGSPPGAALTLQKN